MNTDPRIDIVTNDLPAAPGSKLNWTKDGHDFVLDLGIMKRAVVIRKFSGMAVFSGAHPHYYAIGQSSYFPFPETMYDDHHSKPEPAMQAAEQYIKDWFKSIFV